MIHLVTYFLLRLFTYPLRFFPNTWIHLKGNTIGCLAYHLLPSYRKRVLSNLALATDLHFSHEEIPQIGRKSLQSLAITCLEFVKLSYCKNLDKMVTVQNLSGLQPEDYKQKGAIFACPHQANWEFFFLKGSQLFSLVGIGKPFKNPYLYAWVKRTRERFGGELFPPKDGIKECLRALNNLKVVGLIVDQATPEQGIQTTFFGRAAWATTVAAVLSHKKKAPLIPATIVRKGYHYFMTFHPAIIPNPQADLNEDVKRLVDGTLHVFEEEIRKSPEQWLWLHNRYKQEPHGYVAQKYRYDSLLVILPREIQSPHLNALMLLRQFYPRAFITVLAPPSQELPSTLHLEIIPYKNIEELFLKDYRHKIVFDFTSYRGLKRHYRKLSTFQFVNVPRERKKRNLYTIIETLSRILSPQ